MAEFNIGTIGAINGPVIMGSGSTQNNSGVFNYSIDSLVRESFKGFDNAIELAKKAGLSEIDLMDLEKRKIEILKEVESSRQSGGPKSCLSEKVGEFISIFRGLTDAFDEGVEIAQKLSESALKLAPIFVPAITSALGIY